MTEPLCRALAAALVMLGLAACATSGPPDTAAANYAESERYLVVTVRNDWTPRPSAGGPAPRGRYGPGYRASPEAERIAEAIGLDHGLTLRNGWPIRMLGVHCVVFAIPDGRPLKRVLAGLRADKRVESAQELNEFRTVSAQVPAASLDPRREWQYSLAALNVEPLHALSQGDGVRVAVIDTGVDPRHPEIQHALAGQLDFVGHGGDRLNPEIHGTAVAGLISAKAGNGLGIAGIAPEAQLYALRACWQPRPDDARGVCNSFTLARALGAAAEVQAQVVNLSLTGPADPLLERMIAAMLGQGTVVVMAAAPAGGRLGAQIPGVLRVYDALAGRPGDRSAIPAPGTDVLSLHPGGQFSFHTGSSIAAAQLSGIAALLLGAKQDLSPSEVADALRTASARLRPIGRAGGQRKVRCVDACEAAAALGLAVSCAGV